MIRYIIVLLLFSCGLSAQTKLRQIERSATKWYVPAAWDSIPGVTGHAMKYIDLETLMDTVGIQQFGIDSIIYRNDSLLIYNGPGYYFAIIPQGLSGAGDDGSVAYWHQDTIAGDTAHFWDRTNKRLGLNTKSPSSLLHVKKNEFSLPVAEFDNPGTNGQTVLIKHGASTDARYPLKIQTPASTTYFDGRGYLGLGTSPGYPLHVYGANGISRFENSGANGDAGFDLRNGNKWWRIALNAEGGTTNNVHFRDVTGSRYPITLQSSNGYVGILNLTPARELHVTGRVRVSTLDSDLTPPTTAGPTKMVITDESGDLSFANIPTIPADSTVVTQGYGITVTESPTNTYNVKADTSKMATLYDVTASNQTLSNASTATTHTTTLSNSGGKVVFKEGSNVTLTTSADTVTIASTGGGGGGIDSTVIIGGWGIESTESPANTFNLIADSTQVASQYDLTLKQDKITGGTTNRVTKFTSASTIGNSQIQDNGTTVGVGALNASYKFYVNSGNMKLGDDVVSGSLNKLYFGDGTFVYVGEDVTDDRLYLRGGSLAVNINGSLGTNGQVLTSNGTTATWATPTTGSGTVTSVQLAAGTGISLAGTNPITTSGTITVTNSAPNVTTNLSYTNTTSPVTLNSSDGTDVTFTAGNNISLATNGNNMTITGTGATGSGTNTHVAFWTGSPAASLTSSAGLIWDNSNTRLIIGAPQTPTRSLDVNGSVRFRTLIADGNNSVGNPGEYLTSNGVGAWSWTANPIQSHGNLRNTSATPTAIGTSYSRINFTNSLVNGGVTADVTTGNEKLTVNAAGNYEISFNTLITGAANRLVQAVVHINGNTSDYFINQTKPANDQNTISSSWIVNLSANDYIDVRILYGTATGTGTDINYSYPFLNIKRLK